MVFKSLQGSGEPCSTGGSSGLCFDNTVDLKGSEGMAPTVASQVSGNILGSEKKKAPNYDLSDVEGGKCTKDFP